MKSARGDAFEKFCGFIIKQLLGAVQILRNTRGGGGGLADLLQYITVF